MSEETKTEATTQDAPKYEEMSKEDLVAQLQGMSQERQLYQERFATQLQSEYETAPGYIKKELDIEELMTDPMRGLATLEGMKTVYNDIVNDFKSAAPPEKDPTSVSPSATGGQITGAPRTLKDAVAFLKRKK